MKFLFCFCFMGLCLSPFSWSQTLSSKDRQAIMQVLKQQENCWNQADIDCFMEGYLKTDSLLFIGSGGVQSGWDNTMARYKRSYPDKAAMGKLTFTILKIRKLDKKTAFVLGRFHLKRDIGDLSGIFSLIWKKVNGQWYIISDHTS